MPNLSEPVGLGTDQDRTLTPAEAAEFLGVSAKTLNNWRSKGRGPAYVKYAGAVDGRGVSEEAWSIALLTCASSARLIASTQEV